jgi:hypothetical protein
MLASGAKNTQVQKKIKTERCGRRGAHCKNLTRRELFDRIIIFKKIYCWMFENMMYGLLAPIFNVHSFAICCAQMLKEAIHNKKNIIIIKTKK